MKRTFVLTVLLGIAAATSYSQSTQPSQQSTQPSTQQATQQSYDPRAANEVSTPNHDPLRNFGWIG
jgi:hypothetical protein